MRIVMLSWEYPPKVVGGLARHVQELSEALVRRGHEVHVVTGDGKDVPADEVLAGVEVHRVRGGYPSTGDFYASVLNLNFALLEKVLALGEKLQGTTIVHAHDWLVAFAAAALKHAWRRPLVATIHATEWGRNQGLHNDLSRRISDAEWWLSYEAWRVVTCSYHMRDEVRQVFQVPGDKIKVIPNGVNPRNFQTPAEEKAAVRARFATPGEKLVFFLGRLVREKGADLLLEGAPKILHYSPGVRLVIGGTGPLLEELKAKAVALGVAELVSFPGFVDDATRNALVAAADVAVYPSLYEPFGIVALEAMAAGTPVVVADTGGFSEIVVHGVNGLKAYPGNADSVANNVLTLLHEPELARSLAAQAAEDVRDYYLWDGIARATEDVYQGVLAEFAESLWGAGQDAAAQTRFPWEADRTPLDGEHLSAYLPAGWGEHHPEAGVFVR